MTVAIQGWHERARAVALVRRVNFAVVVFLALYIAIGLLQPTYLEPAGAMNFLRRAAPLAILASGQLFVLVSGGFDLSVGSLVTLTVDRRIDADGERSVEDLVDDRGPLRRRPHRRAHQRSGRRLSQDAVDHRHPRHALVGQRRGDDVVRRVAARISAGQFSHVRTFRVPRRPGHQDLPARGRGPHRGDGARALGIAREPCSAGGCSRSATTLARRSWRASRSNSCASAYS